MDKGIKGKLLFLIVDSVIGQALRMFRTTYACESVFSTINFMISISHENLTSELRYAVSTEHIRSTENFLQINLTNNFYTDYMTE